MNLPLLLKTGGYLVSTISVVLLATVAAPKAAESPIMLACLIGGALTSIVGMACRWLSYQIEKRREGK
jgi:biotin transporter BioY